MKQTPILFQTDMVRGILEKRKRQTRRTKNLKEINKDPDRYEYRGLKTIKEKLCVIFRDKTTGCEFPIKSPYGTIGDQLWVKETWRPKQHHFPTGPHFEYRATAEEDGNPTEGPWQPSIFMPREARRITLEITYIKVERLQEITPGEAVLEGIESEGIGFKAYRKIHSGPHKGGPHPWNSVPNASAKTSYEELWEAINGEGSWEHNPWVWVIDFKTTRP